jgi:hypothetical protein
MTGTEWWPRDLNALCGSDAGALSSMARSTQEIVRLSCLMDRKHCLTRYVVGTILFLYWRMTATRKCTVRISSCQYCLSLYSLQAGLGLSVRAVYMFVSLCRGQTPLSTPGVGLKTPVCGTRPTCERQSRMAGMIGNPVGHHWLRVQQSDIQT